MAWTAPRTWTTSELVTAAMMNTHVRDNLLFLGSTAVDSAIEDISGFTNTAYADLDALTTVSGSAVSVSIATGTTAIVIVSASRIVNTTAAQVTFLSYRVSGASTIASGEERGISGGDDSSLDGARSSTYVDFQNGLTPGTNVFELQAKVSANAGRYINPTITVIPLTT